MKDNRWDYICIQNMDMIAGHALIQVGQYLTD